MNYGSGSYAKYKPKKGMNPKKKALKKFFRKGLATLGEKKVYAFNTDASLSVSTTAAFTSIAWNIFQVPLDSIV